MTDGVVFFCRCRPQDADPIDLVLRERRVFIGWPAWRDGVEPRREHLRDAIVDLRCSDEEWTRLYRDFGNDRKQYQQNRNFARLIGPGAIALVPRPSRGVIYAGRVIKPFELIDNPPWADDYLKLRNEQGCPEGGGLFSHLGDVAQCWEVDHFRPIPFPLVPAWIRRSLLGRSTYGRIWPLSELALDPYPVLDRLIDHPERAERPWTVDPAEVEHRLVESIGPATFEHLCVSLLQLEHPDEVWVHVGGSGDGGVDGIGADTGGKVVGVLQCKWAYYGEAVAVADKSLHGTARQILAALLHPSGAQSYGDTNFLGRKGVASLVIKHAAQLPIAVSLRVGVQPARRAQ